MPPIDEYCERIEGFVSAIMEEYNSFVNEYEDLRAEIRHLEDELENIRSENEDLRNQLAENPEDFPTVRLLQKENVELKNTVIELTLRLEDRLSA